jgi:cytochrome P450 family 12
MKTLRDDKSEMPADFSNYLNSWSLESVVSIALEKRLHVMSGEIKDKNAQELIKLIRKFFEQTVEFEAKLTIWRYYQTKAFKELLGVYDGITK